MMFIDTASKAVVEARFLSNGCGYMVAAADALAERLEGLRITDLNGAYENELTAAIEKTLSPFPEDRKHCLKIAIDSLREALADHRSLLIEEFAGEKVLICTCFGVAEETIESVIGKGKALTVDEVAEACRAGTGCGSCRMLIQEMLDAADSK